MATDAATSDWVLRAEGVNFGDTVWNTNDLSCIRGASLCLEAIGVELEAYFRGRPVQADLIMHGGSIAAFRLHGLTEAAALALRDDVDARLRGSYDAEMDRPKPVSAPNVELSELSKDGEVLLEHRAPTEHMTIMVDVEPIRDGNVSAALRWAQVRSRRRQMRSPNVPRSAPASVDTGLLADKARRQCPVDPLRFTPDTDSDLRATTIVTSDQYPNAETIADNALPEALKRIKVCRRVADLRSYGRHARREIYIFHLRGAVKGPETQSVEALQRLEEAGLFETHDFARSFRDIVADPDPELPISQQGKLAFLYFDGNRFSDLRDRIGNMPDFSEFVRMANSHALEELILRFIAEDKYGERPWAWASDGRLQVKRHGRLGWEDRRLLRMETLIFGGEDSALVVPAWLAFDIAAFMLDAFSTGAANAAKALGLELTTVPSWRVGVLICDQRTPARRGVTAAEVLCKDAKEALHDTAIQKCLSFHISESHDVPELSHTSNAVEALRIGYQGFELGGSQKPGRALRAAGADLECLFENISQIKAILPRSQVYRMISELIQERKELVDSDMVLDREAAAFRDLMQDISFRSREELSVSKISDLLPAKDSAPLMRLIALAELWDYVGPFADGTAREDAA